MTDFESDNTKDLDKFFSAAKTEPPTLDMQFLQTLHEQAHDAMPRAESTKRGLFGGFRDMLAQFGGWPAGASFATAVVAGFFFGVSPPDAILDITSLYFDTESVFDISGVTDNLLEGV